jgi:hypothetical protein
MVCVESKTRSQREVDTAVAEGGGVWLVLHVIFQYSVGSLFSVMKGSQIMA